GAAPDSSWSTMTGAIRPTSTRSKPWAGPSSSSTRASLISSVGAAPRRGLFMHRALVISTAIVLTVANAVVQTPAREQIARGIALWDQRLSKSAIAALETAAGSRPTPAEAAEIHEMLGRIYTFKGWQQESVFPG